MIPEKMQELVALLLTFEDFDINKIVIAEQSTCVYNGKKYNIDKISERINQLQDELLEPYVIKSDLKE